MKHPKRKLTMGFTIIELMITVTLFAIIAGLTYPSVSEFLASQRSQAASEELLSAIQLARSEAAKLSQVVNISNLDTTPEGTDWSKGWHVWVDVNKSGKFEGTDDLELLQKSDLAEQLVITTSSPLQEFGFNGQGFVYPQNHQAFNPQSLSFEFCAGKKGAQLNVYKAGRIEKLIANCQKGDES